MVELVDSSDLGSDVARRAGSSPAIRTIVATERVFGCQGEAVVGGPHSTDRVGNLYVYILASITFPIMEGVDRHAY